METAKAHERRKKEGWYKDHVNTDRPGLDIGCGDDPLNAVFRRWDKQHGDGDAVKLTGIPNDCFWTVYASHVLEHLHDPLAAVKEWLRVLHPSGKLIICVPDIDLYEGKADLPSRWNGDHKTFWRLEYPLPNDGNHVKGLKETIEQAHGKILHLTTLKYGHEYPDKLIHPRGEYSLEVIAAK